MGQLRRQRLGDRGQINKLRGQRPKDIEKRSEGRGLRIEITDNKSEN